MVLHPRHVERVEALARVKRVERTASVLTAKRVVTVQYVVDI